MTVIDQTETETFDLELDRDGNVYSTVLPVEPEPNSVVREEVRIVLDVVGLPKLVHLNS